jgi:hypothetical protein
MMLMHACTFLNAACTRAHMQMFVEIDLNFQSKLQLVNQSVVFPKLIISNTNYIFCTVCWVLRPMNLTKAMIRIEKALKLVFVQNP